MKFTLSNCITLLALVSVPAALAQSEQNLASQEPQKSVEQTANEMSPDAIVGIDELGANVIENINALGADEKAKESHALEPQAAAESQAAVEPQATADAQAGTEKANEINVDTHGNANEKQAEAGQVEMEADPKADEKDNGLTQSINVVENVDPASYAATVAVASFPGPNIVGEFSFYQDSTGKVVATGALQKGLVPDAQYHFRFHNGPSCESLGEAVSHHSFRSMRVMEVGGTAPIQETIEDVHLTGKNGLVGSPWVLSDGTQDVACVVLKGQ